MMVETINASNADILHVSIPTPMQQNWVWEVADRLNVPVIITGGSYLDHLAERVYWYPAWINKTRLGWAYRLEPRARSALEALLTGSHGVWPDGAQGEEDQAARLIQA